MKKLAVSLCAACACALLFCGCGGSDLHPGVNYFYKPDALDPAAKDTSDQTMYHEPEQIDPNVAALAAEYDATHAAAPVKVAAVATPSPAPALPAPLASKEDIEAAKARVKELRGSVTTAKNGAITGLRVESADTTLEDMELFGRLADLESFFFLGEVFDDEMLGKLSNLKNVKSATVQNSSITVATLEMFKTWENLTTLDIRRDLKLEDKDLALIQEFPKLERLNAYYNSFKNSGMNRISKSPTLKIVDVRGCADISDSGAKFLARLATLEEIYFRFGISNEGVANLAAAPNLKFVEFQDCNIDNACAATFANYPALTGLRIFRCKSFTDEGIQGLAGLKLERLELRDLNATDAGVATLKELSGLRSVELSELAVSDGMLNELCGSENWKDMETLDFFSVPVTDETVKVIAENMKSLKNLQVRASSGKNTDATIDEIVKMDSLVTLDLRENTGISPEAFMKLADMKNLRKIYVKDTKFGDSSDAGVKLRDEFKKKNAKISISTEG